MRNLKFVKQHPSGQYAEKFFAAESGEKLLWREKNWEDGCGTQIGGKKLCQLIYPKDKK